MAMLQRDRIRLAKFVGWKFDGLIWHGKGSTWDSLIFDPETDTNDDYAVLEQLRKTITADMMDKFTLLEITGWNYQKGDYARAALKVIPDE